MCRPWRDVMRRRCPVHLCFNVDAGGRGVYSVVEEAALRGLQALARGSVPVSHLTVHVRLSVLVYKRLHRGNVIQ